MKNNQSLGKNKKILFKISEDVVWRDDGDNRISIVHLKLNTTFFTVDGFAANLWKSVNGKRTLGEIFAKAKPPKNEKINRQFLAKTEKLFRALAREKLIVPVSP